MRHNKLTCALLLLTAGCSTSGDGEELLELPAVSETPPSSVEALVDDPAPTAEGGGYGIIMIDTTSSMTTVRSSTGNTRCDDAKVMAESIINDFFDPSGIDGDGIAIWGFTNTTQTTDDVQPATTGYFTDAESAIESLAGFSCAGSTPLADAMCKGLNGDGETFTIDPMLDQLFILTDGFENNSDGPCSGPSGSTETPGTWQYNVIAQMAATGIRVSTRYWLYPELAWDVSTIGSLADGDYDPSTEELLLVADVEELPSSTVDALMATASGTSAAAAPLPTAEQECDTTCRELALFEVLAVETGGSWGIVADDDPNYPRADAIDPQTGPVHPSPEPGPSPVGVAPASP
ncbi:MAG: hypothetical protein AB1Z98_30650 [Nannocystaceae bacterium]